MKERPNPLPENPLLKQIIMFLEGHETDVAMLRTTRKKIAVALNDEIIYRTNKLYQTECVDLAKPGTSKVIAEYLDDLKSLKASINMLMAFLNKVGLRPCCLAGECDENESANDESQHDTTEPKKNETNE
ncbi:MAG: hypothetical protein ACRC2T_12210 [Thermoguttaceae bacterium]